MYIGRGTVFRGGPVFRPFRGYSARRSYPGNPLVRCLGMAELSYKWRILSPSFVLDGDYRVYWSILAADSCRIHISVSWAAILREDIENTGKLTFIILRESLTVFSFHVFFFKWSTRVRKLLKLFSIFSLSSELFTFYWFYRYDDHHLWSSWYLSTGSTEGLFDSAIHSLTSDRD